MPSPYTVCPIQLSCVNTTPNIYKITYKSYNGKDLTGANVIILSDFEGNCEKKLEDFKDKKFKLENPGGEGPDGEGPDGKVPDGKGSGGKGPDGKGTGEEGTGRKDSGLSTGAIVGIVLAAITALVLIGALAFFLWRRHQKMNA